MWRQHKTEGCVAVKTCWFYSFRPLNLERVKLLHYLVIHEKILINQSLENSRIKIKNSVPPTICCLGFFMRKNWILYFHFVYFLVTVWNMETLNVEYLRSTFYRCKQPQRWVKWVKVSKWGKRMINRNHCRNSGVLKLYQCFRFPVFNVSYLLFVVLFFREMDFFFTVHQDIYLSRRYVWTFSQ